MLARISGRLHPILIGVFIASLLLGLFLPVYTDEIGWRFNMRAAIDGVDKLYSDGCGVNTLQRPPFFIMPARYYSALFNGLFPDPFYVRLSGILYALVWTALLLVFVRRLAPEPRERIALSTLAIGLMALGVMPLLLVWSRPEQPILLAAIGALLIAWADWSDPERATAPRRAWLRSLGIVALVVIAASYHLKGLFLVPLFLTCLAFASRGPGTRAPRWIAAGLIAAVTLASLRYWTQRMACPDDAILAGIYSRHSLGVGLLQAGSLSDAAAAIGKLIGNATPWTFFGAVAPKPNPMSNWLPRDQVDAETWIIWRQGLTALWSAAAVLLTWCLAATSLRAWRARRLDKRAIVAWTLVAAVVGWTATQMARNIYDASFVLPCAMLAVVIGLAGHRAGEARRAIDGLVVVIAVCGLASSVAVAAIYGPALLDRVGQSYVAGQGFSQSAFGYARTRRDIESAARLCGMSDPHRQRALMIDDVTYFAMMPAPLPQHVLGVTGYWKGEIDDPVAYLRSRGSTGIIAGCHHLPPALLAQAKRQGEICCIGF